MTTRWLLKQAKELSMWQTIVSLLIICLFFLGCGSDEASLQESVQVYFVLASPPVSEEIVPNGTITVTFDGELEDVRVSAGTVTVVGKTAIITGHFIPGPPALTITWKDGIQLSSFIDRPSATGAFYKGRGIGH